MTYYLAEQKVKDPILSPKYEDSITQYYLTMFRPYPEAVDVGNECRECPNPILPKEAVWRFHNDQIAHFQCGLDYITKAGSAIMAE